MLSLSTNVQIYLCTAPTDMRKSFDGLSGLVASVMNKDLLSGHLFLFLNRRRDRIKLMYWDRDGLAIWYKRLSTGKFRWWPSSPSGPAKSLAAHQLHVLLSAGNPDGTTAAPDWRPVGPKG